VKTATREKKIPGLQASRGGVMVTQLAFADDCLLVARAEQDEVMHMESIVEKYCEESTKL